MERRNFLKVAPLAALAPVTLKVGDTEAKAVELKAAKHYVFVFSDAIIDHDSASRIMETCKELKKDAGIEITAVFGDPNFQIYELDK